MQIVCNGKNSINVDILRPIQIWNEILRAIHEKGNTGFDILAQCIWKKSACTVGSTNKPNNDLVLEGHCVWMFV